MNDVKRELIQTVQWRFEVKDFFFLNTSIELLFSIQLISPIHLFDLSPVFFFMVHPVVVKLFLLKH
jgi:hypothetical protein